MGYTKLFSDIVCSSIWNEDDKTRLVWITILAIKGANHIARATIGGLAHQARVSVEDCQRAIEKLTSPDPDGLDQPEEGRRIRAVEHGWLVLNGQAYKEKKDPDQKEQERREYQKIYHQEYRRKHLRKQINFTQTNVNNSSTNVNTPLLSPLPQSPSPLNLPSPDQIKEKSSCFVLENEPSRASNGAAPKEKKGHSILMSNAELKRLEANPAYEGIDLVKEAFKFNQWCETNKKLTTVRRFVNWINKIV